MKFGLGQIAPPVDYSSFLMNIDRSNEEVDCDVPLEEVSLRGGRCPVGIGAGPSPLGLHTLYFLIA